MDGLIIIDKPAGLTSHDVVARVRRILREKRVGHTGTLDPFATGVIVILVGRATRLAQFLSGAEKEYEATIRFGFATDTGDLTGQPVTGGPSQASETLEANDESLPESESPMESGRLTESESPEPFARSSRAWTQDEIEAALSGLRGPRLQVPPMYSAKKIDGRKLYELARRGLEVERTAAPVIIHRLETMSHLLETIGGPDSTLLRRNADGTLDMDVRVVCSAGTYIRVLAEEIGARLGTGAHLARLRRTRAGQFTLAGAVTLEELQASEATDILLAPDAALSFMPFLHLTNGEAARAKQGARLRPRAAPVTALNDGARVRLLDESGSLIAVGVYEAETHMVHPRVVVSA